LAGHVKLRARSSAVFGCKPTRARQIQVGNSRHNLPTEFVGLRSKMYSLTMLDGSRSFLKAKGVPRSYVKQNVRHRVSERLEALECLKIQVSRVQIAESSECHARTGQSLPVLRRRQAPPARRRNSLSRLRSSRHSPSSSIVSASAQATPLSSGGLGREGKDTLGCIVLLLLTRVCVWK